MMGKMRNASQGVPGTDGLFTPFNRVLAQEPKHVWFRKGSELANALQDWRAIFNIALACPTHVKQLVCPVSLRWQA